MPTNGRTFILGVGCQKCGTAWLYKYMQQFPNFAAGLMKEYHIWDALDLPAVTMTDRGVHREQLRARMLGEPGFYFAYFDALFGGTRNLTADITPSYSGLGSERLAAVRAGFARIGVACKAVVLIRDPVERIKSAVRFGLDRGTLEPRGLPGEAGFLDAVRRYYPSKACAIRTNYHETLEAIAASFAPADMYVGVYETMFEPSEVARLSAFLGLTPKVNFASVRVNSAKTKPSAHPTLEAEIRDHYRDVYAYCHEHVPVTRVVWR